MLRKHLQIITKFLFISRKYDVKSQPSYIKLEYFVNKCSAVQFTP